MLAIFISSFVFAGLLSAYIFLGRSLTRQGNAAILESRSRVALYYFNQDVSAATEVTIDSNNQLGLTVVNPLINLTPPNYVSVIYTYDSNDNLTRSVYLYVPPASYPPTNLIAIPSGLQNPLVLLAGPTTSTFDNLNFSFGYYNFGGITPYVFPSASPPGIPPGTSWIKQVSMTFKSTAGAAATGAQSHFTVVSSQVVMKNKALLQ